VVKQRASFINQAEMCSNFEIKAEIPRNIQYFLYFGRKAPMLGLRELRGYEWCR